MIKEKVRPEEKEGGHGEGFIGHTSGQGFVSSQHHRRHQKKASGLQKSQHLSSRAESTFQVI